MVYDGVRDLLGPHRELPVLGRDRKQCVPTFVPPDNNANGRVTENIGKRLSKRRVSLSMPVSKEEALHLFDFPAS